MFSSTSASRLFRFVLSFANSLSHTLATEEYFSCLGYRIVTITELPRCFIVAQSSSVKGRIVKATGTCVRFASLNGFIIVKEAAEGTEKAETAATANIIISVAKRVLLNIKSSSK